MEIIAADYVGMIQKSDELGYLLTKLVAEINRLKMVMNDIDIFWDGEANSEFKLALNADFCVMEALCLKVRLSANLLKQAVYDYVQTENEINYLIGG